MNRGDNVFVTTGVLIEQTLIILMESHWVESTSRRRTVSLAPSQNDADVSLPELLDEPRIKKTVENINMYF